jgi:hypothetical protein
MKQISKILYISGFLLCVTILKAQMPTPALSSTVKTETTVGFTAISLNYSRPSKKGRTIFGDFVPYNEIWRTGANKNSLISFSDDVIIGNKEVKKGIYAIYSKPNQTVWEVYFYSDIENVGLPKKWEEEKIVAKVTVIPKTNSTVETFTLNIGNVTNSSFQLEIIWDNILVPIKIEVPTEQKVSSNITNALSNPSSWDYYFFARYYEEDKKNLNQALTWINKSVEMMSNEEDVFFPLRIKALIEADLGDYKSAINTAKLSLEKSEKVGNKEYIKMNTKSISEWSSKK